MLAVGLWIGDVGVVTSFVTGLIDDTELRRPNGLFDIDMVRRNDGRCLVVGVPSRKFA
jgi:hypothetical protein